MRRKKKTKKYIRSILIICIFCGFILTGCGGKEVADQNGNLERLKLKDIEQDGLYVKNSDNTFSPVINEMPGFDGKTAESKASRYVWYTDEDANYSNLIPTVTEDNPLVIIYSSNRNMPEDLYLEKYASKGWTVGAHISISEDKEIYLSSENTLSNSSANKVLKQLTGGDKEYNIESVSGAKSLPINNVDPNMSFLLGLEKDKVYTFRIFEGTRAKDVKMYADTKVFQSAKIINLPKPYKHTNKGYFIINLPNNLQEGYYYLSDLGFFKYKERG